MKIILRKPHTYLSDTLYHETKVFDHLQLYFFDVINEYHETKHVLNSPNTITSQETDLGS